MDRGRYFFLQGGRQVLLYQTQVIISINIFQRRSMKPKDSDESDNEGFVPNQIKIHSHNIHPQEINHHKPKNFEPQYIVGEGLLRKEPLEIIKPFRHIPRKPRNYPCKNIVRDSKEELQTVHELYNNKNRYSLVYSRFKQPFGHGQRCAFEHLVKLECCEKENQQNFRTLKDWDEKCMDSQNFTQSTLVFDSLFEGGNLRCAFKEKKQPNTYVLFMQNDTNTYGYNQWFYFSVRNAKQNTKYTFKIANFKKSYSFFNNGLQPLIFSLQKDKQDGQGWYRDGTNISYSPSNFKDEGSSAFYTLQFTLQFDYPNDYITVSPNPPYSYTKLITTLNRFETIATKNNLSWKMKCISSTVARNQVPYVIISNKSVRTKQKKKIVLMARQHSGEIWSSYLVEEIMLQLIQKTSKQAKWLLQNFDFHIFPMINVDGVIYGNFRCDIAGNDLNRTWKSPLQNVQPQIYKIKKELFKLADNEQIQMCLDLHTHSRDYGIFAYCCVDNKQCRELPSLLSQSTSLFRYGACTFGIMGEKQFTARASVYGMTSNVRTLTIQLSAYGYKLNGRRYAIPYTPSHMINIASSILKTYHAFKNNLEPQREVIEQPEEINPLELTENCQGGLSNVDVPVEGSDSQPQADEIELAVKIKQIYPHRFVEDIQYDKFKKLPSTNSKKYKRPKKQITTLKSQTKTKERTKVQTSQVKQQTKATSPPPIIFDEIISVLKEDASSIQNRPKNVTWSNPKQPVYKKQNKVVSEKNGKSEVQKPAKPLNLVEFSLKKLPIFPPQKIIQPQVNAHILLNEPPLMNGFHSSKKQQRLDKTYSAYEAMCRPRVRIQSRRLGFERDSSRLQQELPFLCIMSETKKQMQLEKIKQKKEERSFERKPEGKYLINGHRHEEASFMKYRDKHRQIDLFSKIGLQNFTRYAENSFFRQS